ncbi:TIGR02611 family protein [Mycolicibacterium litorale]|uniref:TIGR02611 family protein n=1 Tax=Mycolicibacterium litorale TaxID=758802 RepID=A0A6S6P459_9MYCO|nr:TIGR02611 family protein [Mycolicibacterium litorale]BCI52912.1 TIGR02611 family protein [Mycolicibacterium litorale]
MTENETEQPSRWTRIKERWKQWREGLRRRPRVDFFYRIAVGVIGLVVLALGVLAIPYPGPGWAIVFIGLGILATEFDWAKRLLAYARERYDRVMDWFHGQGPLVQVLGGLLTAVVVFTTLWLLGAVGWAGELVGFDQQWLDSPLGFGSS